MARYKRRKLYILLILLCIFFGPLDLYASKFIEQPLQGYYASIPKTKSGDRALPVLVCFPGAGIKARDDINHWAFVGNKKGFVVITMDVNYMADNAQIVHDRMKIIIESLSASYPINKNKVFISGTSAGGMMAIALGLLYPGQFQAIGAVSGARIGFGAETALRSAKGQVFYLFHGKNDRTIRIGEFYKTKKRLEKQGGVVEAKIFSDSGHTLPPSCYRDLTGWFYQLADLQP